MRPTTPSSSPFRRGVAALLVAVCPTVFTTGCFGSFQLTRKVYEFNRTVSPDKWIRWIAFLAMNVIPIYGFSLWIDALFANSVEFWSGRNPISASHDATRELVGPNGELARATRQTDGSILLEVTETDGTRHAVRFAATPDGLAAYEPGSDAVLGRLTLRGDAGILH